MLAACMNKYHNETPFKNNLTVKYCHHVWDGYLCWPSALSNTSIQQHCPKLPGVNVREFAHRYCNEMGEWANSSQAVDEDGRPGWTDYSECFTKEFKDLLSISQLHEKLEIAKITRIMEYVGYISSLLFISVSLLIFSYFRSLKNHRTIIHTNLMVSMIIQITIRLTVYTDQNILLLDRDHQGIHSSIICEGIYIVLEFAKTSMFMWFFVEGYYLNEVVVVASLNFKPNYTLYFIIGWGFPVVLTTVWAVVTSYRMSNIECWFLYSQTPYYWIIEGPRIAILCINFIYLMATLRILISKLNSGNSRRMKRIMKAIRATIVLIPLLGISNGLVHFSPKNEPIVIFALWAITSHFFSAFQGVFISLLYCICNKEVRCRLKKEWNKFRTDSNNHGEENNRRIGSDKAKSDCAENLREFGDRQRKLTLQTTSSHL